MIEKNIPFEVKKCLIEYNIRQYPVDLLRLARNAGIKIVKDESVRALALNERGKCITDGREWIIVYDGNQPPEQIRFTVAHELGHIFLGHREEHISFVKRIESQADAFAFELLNVR